MKALWSVLVVAVAVAASVLVTARVMREDPAPPPPSGAALRTAPVTLERLDRRMVFRGSMQQSEQRLAVTGVVSHLPLEEGAEVVHGTAVLEIEGRPLLALPLPFPLWRDLQPMDRGRDVQAVQHALTELDVFSGAIDGVYGPVTQRGVVRLYTRAGYDPPPQVFYTLDGTIAGRARTDGELAATVTSASSAERTSTTLPTPTPDPTPEGPPMLLGTPLPAAEVLAVGEGKSWLALNGVQVGDVLSGGDGPSLRTADVTLVVSDGGSLAEVATPGMLVRLGLDSSAPEEHRVERVAVASSGESRLLLSGSSAGLAPGELVSGALVLAETETAVMAVPSAALRSPSRGTTSVTVLGDDGEPVDVAVQIGFRGDELVEIRSEDVEVGDVVVLSR